MDTMDPVRPVWVADSAGPSGSRLVTVEMHYRDPMTGCMVVQVMTHDSVVWRALAAEMVPGIADWIRNHLEVSSETPRSLGVGEWHLPYVHSTDREEVGAEIRNFYPAIQPAEVARQGLERLKQLSVARCYARERGQNGPYSSQYAQKLIQGLLEVGDVRHFVHVAQATVNSSPFTIHRGFKAWCPHRAEPYQEVK